MSNATARLAAWACGPDSFERHLRKTIMAETCVCGSPPNADCERCRLVARVAELEALVASLSERVHKQSELLSKRAEKE